MLEAAVLLTTTATTLTGLYWGALILGGGLLLVSVLGGLGHHQADVDAGGNAGLEAHTDFDGASAGHADADAGPLSHHEAVPDSAHAAHDGVAAMSTWFSLRFAVFFLAMYGATGVILTYLSGASTWMVFSLALVIGLAVGQGAHQTFQFIRRTSGDSTPRALDYVNRLGRVTIAVSPPEKGEVALEVRGTERFVPAVAAERTGFDVGDEVVVVDYRDGVAHVTRPIGKT
jgi:membrane protein implicated in regulation of membrane protease activity